MSCLLACLSTLAIAVSAAPLESKLLAAIRKTDLAKVERLLHAGASPNARDRWGASALYLAAETVGRAKPEDRGAAADIVRLLVRQGARVRPLFNSPWSSLPQQAVEAVLAECIEGEATEACQGALAIASRFGLDDSIERLIASGLDIAESDDFGHTPIILAAMGGHRGAMRLLLERGADPNRAAVHPQTQEPMATALGQIAFKQDEIGEKMLLAAGADSALALKSIQYQQKHATAEQAERWLAAARFLDRNRQAAAPGMSQEHLAALVKAAIRDASRPETPSEPQLHSDVDAASYQHRERPDDFAVVVGVERYMDLPSAPHAERDAQAVQNHLLSLGVPRRNLILLTGEKAGYKSIEKYLRAWLPKNSTPKSRVYFYFAGHGAPNPSTGRAYLVPWDGDPNFLETTGYPLSRLYEELESLNASETFLILDACFSGAGGRSVLAKGTRPLVTSIQTAPSKGKLTVFSAASTNEVTSTREDQGHGSFTYHFLKGLGGAAKDGKGSITVSSLYQYLKPRVADDARRQNREQTATLTTAAPNQEIIGPR